MAKTKKPLYSLRSFFSYLSQYKLRVTVTTIVFILPNILLAVLPVFIGLLVAELASQNVDYSQVQLFTSVLVAISVLHLFTFHGGEVVFMKLIRPIGYAYENILFSEVIRKPYPYFIDKFTGKISANISTLDNEFRNFLDTIFYSYLVEIVRMIAIIIILISMNIYTGLVFITGIVLMFLVGRVTIKNSSLYEKKWTDINSSKTGQVVDAVANFSNVKSFSKEVVEIKSIARYIQLTTEAGNKSFFWNIIFWSSVGFFVRVFIWPLTIVLNVWLFSQGVIGLAELTTVLAIIVMFSDFVWGTIWNVSQFNLKLARMEEAHHYIFGNVNIVKQYYERKALGGAVPSFSKKLELKNISFAYPDEKNVEVLTDVNLAIKSGEKIGIVGRSGSGKTTLTKLLLGYYPVESGSLIVDGKTVSPMEFAQLIAFVPQDTSLFHRSIADNIGYAANRPVSKNEIVEAAKLAHADEFITRIDKGYEALVGERGVKLSGGQRQRIAIARAILKDSPILVLDEATSALDSESEKLIQASLAELMKNRTSIVIAHRLSTIARLDRIIVLDNGKIAQQGTHADLLASGGIYADLWKHQSGGFIEE